MGVMTNIAIRTDGLTRDFETTKAVDKLDFGYLEHEKLRTLVEQGAKTKSIPMVNGLSDRATELLIAKPPAVTQPVASLEHTSGLEGDRLSRDIEVAWPHDRPVKRSRYQQLVFKVLARVRVGHRLLGECGHGRCVHLARKQRLEHILATAAALTRLPERSLFYGVTLAHYLDQSDAVTQPCLPRL